MQRPQTWEHTCSWAGLLSVELAWPLLRLRCGCWRQEPGDFDGQVGGLGPCCSSFLLAEDSTHQMFSPMLSHTGLGFMALQVELNHTTLILYPKVRAWEWEGLPGASCLRRLKVWCWE